MIEVFFWILISLILYVYLGYPLLLVILTRIKPPSVSLNTSSFRPTVSLLIAAYNEEKNISRKIENSLRLDYPNDKMEIVVISDSTDRTNDIVQQYETSGVRLIVPEERKGKISAQNYAIPQLKGEIIIITDADITCETDSVRHIVEHFSDETVGCVIGKTEWINKDDNVITQGGNLYYNYELFLRKKESDLGMLGLGSTGLMAFRKELFFPIPPFLAEDTFLPLSFLYGGYKVVYEPKSVTKTIAASSGEGEFRIRERNANIDTSALIYMKSLLNPIKYFMPSLMLVSHKLGRWFVPFLMSTLFFLNIFLLGTPIYNLLFTLQLIFYLLSFLGFILSLMDTYVKYLNIPYYFCLINLAAAIGFLKALFGRKQTMWEPVRS